MEIELRTEREGEGGAKGREKKREEEMGWQRKGMKRRGERGEGRGERGEEKGSLTCKRFFFQNGKQKHNIQLHKLTIIRQWPRRLFSTFCKSMTF